MQAHDGNGSIVTDMVKGAIAGAVGVWAMDRVTWLMWDREDPKALRQEKEARPEGLDAGHKMAGLAANAVGLELNPKQPHPAGIATHYSFGIVPGVLYGAMRKHVNGLNTGRGALYGMGVFLVEDELTNTLTGLSSKPMDYPWQAHARGVVGHLTYGIVMDSVLNALDRLKWTAKS